MNNYSDDETVNAGTGKELTIKELTELVAKVIGYDGKILWDTTKPNGTPRKLLDVSKAEKLGWKYKTELEEGIRLSYEDFLNNLMEQRDNYYEMCNTSGWSWKYFMATLEKNYPKQFLNICEGRSLLQDTIVRNMPFVDEFIIVTNENYADIMETQLKAFQDVRYRIIYESRSCGTFAAVSLASVFMNPSDLMMVTVSDLVIESGSYKDSVIKAKEVAKTGTIANIVSSRNEEHAGIYVCMVGVFNKALRGIYPDIAQTRKVIRRKLKTVSHIINVPENIMERFPKLRMQADLFTRIDDITEINADFEYRDIDSIADINDEDNQNDYGHKNIINNECEDVVMINTADKHLIVANHINNISIVNTEDATYISDREHGPMSRFSTS